MKKVYKILMGILAAILIVFLSIDLERLDEYKAGETTSSFNPEEYVARFWEEKLPECINEATDSGKLTDLLQQDPARAFEQFGRKLGIARTNYFLIKGSGHILSKGDEFITVLTEEGDTIRLATAFIFGNAVRDGSGMVDINDFINMTDFNSVSIALNRLVRDSITDPLARTAESGQYIQFAGVAELRQDQPFRGSFNVIPVKAIISDGSPE